MLKRRLILALLLLVSALTVAASAWAFRLSFFSVRRNGIRGEFRSTESGLRHSSVGLQGFKFEFRNGDHKINTIGAIPSGSQMVGKFTDNDGNDPYNYSASYIKLPLHGSTQRYVARQRCHGACLVRISAPPHGQPWHFILQGFKLSRRAGRDGHVRRVTVRPEVDRRIVEVRLEPYQGAWDVELAYQYTAASMFTRAGTLNGHRRRNQKYARLVGPAGFSLLRGFDLSFDNGGHFLERFEVIGNGRGFNVWFNDKNHDDPVSITLDYATLDEAHVRAMPR